MSDGCYSWFMFIVFKQLVRIPKLYLLPAQQYLQWTRQLQYRHRRMPVRSRIYGFIVQPLPDQLLWLLVLAVSGLTRSQSMQRAGILAALLPTV